MKTFLAVSCACLIAFATASPALTCDDYPEQWQMTKMECSFEFGDNYMNGSLGHEMDQAMRPDGSTFMNQNQSTYGNFNLEMDGLHIDMNSSGWQSQISPPCCP